MDHRFVIKTPDNNLLHFFLLNKKATEILLNADKHHNLLPTNKLDLFKKAAYKMQDNRVLHCRFSDGTSVVFENEEEYLKALKGANYYDVSIAHHNVDDVFVSFSLLPMEGEKFLKSVKKELREYTPIDRYQAYLLNTGEVCFLRSRMGYYYDGYWYPSKKDFEHFYYSLRD